MSIRGAVSTASRYRPLHNNDTVVIFCGTLVSQLRLLPILTLPCRGVPGTPGGRSVASAVSRYEARQPLLSGCRSNLEQLIYRSGMYVSYPVGLPPSFRSYTTSLTPVCSGRVRIYRCKRSILAVYVTHRCLTGGRLAAVASSQQSTVLWPFSSVYGTEIRRWLRLGGLQRIRTLSTIGLHKHSISIMNRRWPSTRQSRFRFAHSDAVAAGPGFGGGVIELQRRAPTSLWPAGRKATQAPLYRQYADFDRRPFCRPPTRGRPL